MLSGPEVADLTPNPPATPAPPLRLGPLLSTPTFNHSPSPTLQPLIQPLIPVLLTPTQVRAPHIVTLTATLTGPTRVTSILTLRPPPPPPLRLGPLLPRLCALFWRKDGVLKLGYMGPG